MFNTAQPPSAWVPEWLQGVDPPHQLDFSKCETSIVLCHCDIRIYIYRS